MIKVDLHLHVRISTVVPCIWMERDLTVTLNNIRLSLQREACKFAKHHKGDLSGVCVRELIGRTVGEVAPSLLLTSLSETAAFLLGGVSTMPAVRSFSFYAGVAVFFNFLLQVSSNWNMCTVRSRLDRSVELHTTAFR